MKLLPTLAIALLIVAAQAAAARASAIAGGAPHWVLVTVLWFAASAPLAQALFLALAAGALLDALSVDAPVVNTASLALLAWALGRLAASSLIDSAALRALAVGAAIVAFFASRALLVWSLEGAWLDTEGIARSLAVTLVHAWPLFCVLDGFRARIVAEHRRAAHLL